MKTENKNIENHREDIEQFHEYGLHASNRVIYLGSETEEDEVESGTDSQMAKRFIKNMVILNSISNEPIHVILNSPGGDVHNGIAMFDTILTSSSKVIVHVYGQAMSMASLLIQAAHKRILSPNAKIMLHYGIWGIVDHPKTTYKWAEEGKKIDEWMENVFLSKIRKKHSNFKLSELKEMLDHDTFLNAKEAIELGLADGLTGEII